VIPPDDAVALQLALDADEAELSVRRDLHQPTAYRLVRAALDADTAAVQRVWAGLAALAEELADDPAAAEIVDACAEYVVGAQVGERGTARLAELGVTLHSEM
jgi:hypothetical protein